MRRFIELGQGQTDITLIWVLARVFWYCTDFGAVPSQGECVKRVLELDFV